MPHDNFVRNITKGHRAPHNYRAKLKNQSTSYKTTFKNLSDKRKESVRKEIEKGWKQGLTATEISKKVKISSRSIATALGNLTRQAS